MMVMMIVTPMIIASRMTMVLGTMMPKVTTMICTMLVTKTPIVWSVEKKNNVYLSASGDWGPGLADCSLRKNN